MVYAGRLRGRVAGLPRSIHHIVNSSMRSSVGDGQDIDGPIVQSHHKVGRKTNSCHTLNTKDVMTYLATGKFF
jgi:hypothetical protein